MLVEYEIAAQHAKNEKRSTKSTRQKRCSLRSFLDKKDISLNNFGDKILQKYGVPYKTLETFSQNIEKVSTN